MTKAPFDLKERARKAMLNAGFQPDFPPEVWREAKTARPLAPGSGTFRDLRALLWSSIDNDTSRDLDQLEYVEKGFSSSLGKFLYP